MKFWRNRVNLNQVDLVVSEGATRISAKWKGKEIGRAFCNCNDGRHFLIGDFTVDDEYQCKGIGGVLLRKAIEEGLARSHRIIGNVTANDLKASPFLKCWYQRKGFEIVEPFPDSIAGTVFSIEMKRKK